MRRLLIAAALALSPAAARADDPRVVKFAVADLVTPLPDPTSTAKPTPADGAAKLIRTVTTIVKPQSWAGQGGPGSVQYDAAEHTLVVRAAPEVMKEVSDLLAALRKLQETSVVTEVRVVAVPVGFREWCPVKCADGTLLCEAQTAKLMDFVQRNPRANVMQAPKVTTFDGQTATVRVGEEKMFVTGVEAVKVKGQPVLVPKNTPAHTGDAMTLCGRVGGDGKTVTLRVNVTRTRVADKVELVPVTTQVMPIFEGGSQGVPVPFTQYVQAPEFKTFTAERTATVPSCGTVVVGGWKETNRTEFGPPVLSKVPYMNRLFKNTGIEEREVLVLATTRVVTAPPEPPQFPSDAMQPWGGVEVRMIEKERREASQVKMDMAIIEVPADFMTKFGLPADGAKDSRMWTMTARERETFAAALRNAADVKRLAEPTIVTHDSREATFRTGAHAQVVTGLDVSMKNGSMIVVPKTTTVDCGTGVRVTPHVSADGKFVRLNVKATHAATTEMGRKQAIVVPVEQGDPLTVQVEELPKQDVQSVERAVVVPTAGTVVVGGLKPKTPGGKATELLIVMTPHAVIPAPPTPTAVVPASSTTTDLTKY